MPPVPQENPDDPHRLRQQLILAQVRLLELEDTRDALVTKLAMAGRTLEDLQAVAGLKIAERDHAITRMAAFETQNSLLHGQLSQALARGLEIETELARTAAVAGAAQDRVRELEDRIAAMKTSRSWRWSAPLRSLERLFKRSS